jgi:hypothetical protein
LLARGERIAKLELAGIKKENETSKVSVCSDAAPQCDAHTSWQRTIHVAVKIIHSKDVGSRVENTDLVAESLFARRVEPVIPVPMEG